MVIVRLVGLALLLVALAVFGHEVYSAAGGGGYRLISGGGLWFMLRREQPSRLPGLDREEHRPLALVGYRAFRC